MTFDPVNLEETKNISGEFDDTYDVITEEYDLKWNSPPDAQITPTTALAIRGIYKSPWIVRLSLDSGSNWINYRVKKSQAYTFKQQRYIAPELGEGDGTIRLVSMPTFVESDYVVDIGF